MKPRGGRRLATLATLLVSVGLLPHVAVAHTVTKTDADDAPGPLDIAEMVVTHDDTNIKFRFKMYEAWSKSTLLSPSYLLVAVDRDQDLVADRCLFIYYYGGSLRGAMTNCGRRNLGSLPVSRPSLRTATVTTGNISVGQSHYWAAYSFFKRDDTRCAKGCVDAVPNRQPLLHDLVPPTPAWTTSTSHPYLSTALSTTTTIPLDFNLVDTDTQVATWQIDRYTNIFTGTSTVAATGSGNGPTEFDFPATEGETYLLRLSATDVHGNVGVSLNSLRFGVPYDDDHLIAEYEGSWTTTANASYFGGGYHSTSTASDTLTFTVTTSGALGGQTYVYVLGGPGNGMASVSDGTSGVTVDQTPSTPIGQRFPLGSYTGDGTETFTLTVTSGTIIVDAIAVVLV